MTTAEDLIRDARSDLESGFNGVHKGMLPIYSGMAHEKLSQALRIIQFAREQDEKRQAEAKP